MVDESDASKTPIQSSFQITNLTEQVGIILQNLAQMGDQFLDNSPSIHHNHGASQVDMRSHEIDHSSSRKNRSGVSGLKRFDPDEEEKHFEHHDAEVDMEMHDEEDISDLHKPHIDDDSN